MYKITFEDNTTFSGEKPRDWNKISDKRILRLEYILGSKKLIMKNYEMYNHHIKYAEIGGTNHIVQIIIMGLKHNKVTKIICDIKEHTIKRQYAILGFEYNNALTTGWKRGIDNQIEEYQLYAKN